MFSLPEVDVSDHARLADWVELCATFGDVGQVSRADLEDIAHDGGTLGYEPDRIVENEADDLDKDCFTGQDALTRMSEKVWIELRRRSSALRSAYPLEITKSEAVLRGASWKEKPAASALLLADLSKDYTSARLPESSPFRKLFESVVRVSLETTFNGNSVRFGVPVDRRDWPAGVTSIWDRLNELGDRIGLSVQNCEDIVNATDGDLGLDVLTRFSFGDSLPGTCYVLTQCSTGMKWQRDKMGDLSLDFWSRLLSWDGQKLRAIAVPYRVSDKKELRRCALFINAIVIDRIRILAGRPDDSLPRWCGEDLNDWCESHLRKFPLSKY